MQLKLPPVAFSKKKHKKTFFFFESVKDKEQIVDI